MGLVLYDEVLPRVAARSVDRLADPGLSSQAAPGLQYAVPQGGVNNSVYLQLCSSLELERWLLRGAWLEGFSATPNVDLYQTALAGGYPTNAVGDVAESSHLGREWDVRLQYNWNFVKSTDGVFFGLDASYFVPGTALPMMEPTTKVMGYIRLEIGGGMIYCGYWPVVVSQKGWITSEKTGGPVVRYDMTAEPPGFRCHGKLAFGSDDNNWTAIEH